VIRASLANLLTLSRFVFSPLFALFFVLAGRGGASAQLWILLAWGIVVLIELSDVLDGMAARAANAVTDLGKILDPFADVVSKVTYFVCLLTAGIVPLWFVLILLYREFGIILIRMILFRDGVALGARIMGKIKTWFYAISAGVGLFLFSIDVGSTRLQALQSLAGANWLPGAYTALLAFTALLAIGSFTQYLVLFFRTRNRR
jgi:CDP-diacylglycerol---glycerol-3-phosphate 3-phosphatidyltransferase